MTATHSSASTVLVAIDISKHRHEVLIGGGAARNVVAARLGLPALNVPSDMPCLQHRPAHFAPASCSVRMPVICSSLYLVRFIARPRLGLGSNRWWRRCPAARSRVAGVEGTIRPVQAPGARKAGETTPAVPLPLLARGRTT